MSTDGRHFCLFKLQLPDLGFGHFRVLRFKNGSVGISGVLSNRRGYILGHGTSNISIPNNDLIIGITQDSFLFLVELPTKKRQAT